MQEPPEPGDFGNELTELGADVELETEGMGAPEILKDVFGYESFRGDQREIVERVIAGKDTVVLMPTGGGKSLCYQIPALAREGMAVVISPLIALMQDQVSRLQSYGVRADKLNSDMSGYDQNAVIRRVENGDIKLLYVSPERFTGDEFVSLLRRSNISMFAIDEAHCVSQWGHDFRPEYLRVGDITSDFPGIPRIAVTATASPVVRQDMLNYLYLNNAKVFQTSSDRPNLSYRIIDETDWREVFLDFMENERGNTGIVYCLARKQTENIAELLREYGHDAYSYHGGTEKDLKLEVLERFSRGDGIVVVATNAFGMGIDKESVRFIFHTDIPDSIESYSQETGRAGRDGKPAKVWMVNNHQSLIQRQHMLVAAEGDDIEHKIRAWGRLNALVGFIESAECRRSVLLRYFGEELSEPCNNCDRCLSPPRVMKKEESLDISARFLNTILETGQHFGMNYIVDVLTGNEDKKVLERGHQDLAAFGCGRDLGAWWWKIIGRQLYAAGYIESPPILNGGMALTKNGLEVLAGNIVPKLIEPTNVGTRGLKKIRRKSPAALRADAVSVPSGRTQVFGDLVEFRDQVAQKEGLPGHIILHDSTLAAIARAMPDTLSQLSNMPGMGVAKVARYGHSLLTVVLRHKRKLNIDVIAIPGLKR